MHIPRRGRAQAVPRVMQPRSLPRLGCESTTVKFRPNARPALVRRQPPKPRAANALLHEWSPVAWAARAAAARIASRQLPSGRPRTDGGQSKGDFSRRMEPAAGGLRLYKTRRQDRGAGRSGTGPGSPSRPAAALWPESWCRMKCAVLMKPRCSASSSSKEGPPPGPTPAPAPAAARAFPRGRNHKPTSAPGATNAPASVPYEKTRSRSRVGPAHAAASGRRALSRHVVPRPPYHAAATAPPQELPPPPPVRQLLLS